MIKKLSKLLVDWYKTQHRPLPWRADRDPYKIWISEVMLQQTTVAAVTPIYQRFISRFPTVHELAKSPIEDVLQAWAGLGYYTRARNLHRSAIHLSQNGFPVKAAALLELPGFGPYTSRAVASIAFNEAVGVLDGNVIRVLSRVFGLKTEWWKTEARTQLQNLSDEFAQAADPHTVNQALMELGATVCTPSSPACLLCPWMKMCEARQQNTINKIPLMRKKRDSEIWHWEVDVYIDDQKIAFLPNDYAPFLKGQPIFPGVCVKQTQKPKSFDVKHGITHHDIYISIKTRVKLPKELKRGITWHSVADISRVNPSSVIQKILRKVDWPAERL